MIWPVLCGWWMSELVGCGTGGDFYHGDVADDADEGVVGGDAEEALAVARVSVSEGGWGTECGVDLENVL